MKWRNWNSETYLGLLLFIMLAVYPLFTSEYEILNVAGFLSMAFITLSVSLIWGGAGILSFGQAAFFGVGGYLYGIFCTNFGGAIYSLPSLLLALVVSALVAWVLGYFMFYGGVNDVFVGLITLCVSVALETFMAQTAGENWRVGRALLGGFNGMNNIPTISLGNWLRFEGARFYYLVFFSLALVYVVTKSMLQTRFGYSLIAIRENRERTRLLGYNVSLLQTIVFALGGTLAALSGIFYAAWGGYMTPSQIGLTASTLPVVLVAAAGRKNLLASIIASLLYSWLSQYLAASGSQYALVILGFLLVLIILIVPNGIIATAFQWLDHLIKYRRKTAAVKQ